MVLAITLQRVGTKQIGPVILQGAKISGVCFRGDDGVSYLRFVESNSIVLDSGPQVYPQQLICELIFSGGV